MSEYSNNSVISEPSEPSTSAGNPMRLAVEKGLGLVDTALLKIGRLLDPLPPFAQNFSLYHGHPNNIAPKDAEKTPPIKGTVLVVGCIEERMRRIWEESNCQNCICLIAKNNLEAVSLVTRIKFNAVFIPLNCPDLDGITTAKDIRRTSTASDTKIVLIRAPQEAAVEQDVPETDFDATLYWPLGEESVRAVLTDCLHRTAMGIFSEL
jgi:CheY-like chemotaxis protein